MLSALAGWGVLSARAQGNAEASTGRGGRVDAASLAGARGAPRGAVDVPGPVARNEATGEAVASEVVAREALASVGREVVQVVAADAVDAVPAAPAPPSLVRFTPRTRAERVDVWLRFPQLHVKDQLALQDQLPADLAGPTVELRGHRLRLSGPAPAGSILWVSQELGFLGEGAELDEPDLQRAGELRALFVEQTHDGSVRVRSSRPFAP